MKMNKLFTFVMAIASSFVATAQSNLLNARSPEEINQKGIEQIIAESDGPLPYQYVNENDVILQKTVWETIPLDERANLMYYLPIRDTDDRKSLFTVLKEAVLNKEITMVYYSDDFRDKVDLKELKSKFTKTDTAAEGIDQLNYGGELDPQYLITTELTSADVVEYQIKGTWYFDRNEGQLKYRLLGIAPVVVDINTKNDAQKSYIPLFWIFFPDARQVLYQNYAYNEKNEKMRSDYDFLFNARKFSSVIYKVDNIYGEDISTLVGENAMLQLLEAEKIKESIRNIEDDMWNY